ncbi:hypothetical protein L195_g042532 [Trifolium pratense]|uniref:Uncharacterized protein n=1 Tax=Trifolium pratense TaxID=57577 RepID=A0A2K3M6P3_TRIPR|nr:hypothetical protein L195_g042532 [Trifolium pratense]
MYVIIKWLSKGYLVTICLAATCVSREQILSATQLLVSCLDMLLILAQNVTSLRIAQLIFILPSGLLSLALNARLAALNAAAALFLL